MRAEQLLTTTSSKENIMVASFILGAVIGVVVLASIVFLLIRLLA
jgi:hypothetical protein